MKRYKSVDHFIESAEQFQPELIQLRDILNSLDLEEGLKWSFPCYTHAGQNVVGLCCFKAYFGIWFFQGALLKDDRSVLTNAQEGKTKAMRQWRMIASKDIKPRFIKAYVKEAIELAKQGRSIKFDRSKPLVVPPQLQQALSQNTKAAKAFAQLTKGKQREYADYISNAKREQTKATRLAKIMPMIQSGQGLNEQ
ncbi:MAG: YdeI family protein [Planctomycetaceae bacterium]